MTGYKLTSQATNQALSKFYVIVPYTQESKVAMVFRRDHTSWGARTLFHPIHCPVDVNLI